LGILDDNIQVIVQDAGFYATEIRDIQVSLGKKVSFLDPENKVLTKANPQQLTDYEENIKRKNAFRCKDDDGVLNAIKHQKLNDRTGDNWLNGDTMLKKIEKDASDIYYKLEGCFAQFEIEVEELCITWQGTANELIEKVRSELSVRIKEVVPDLSDTDRHSLANTMTSRWIALCPLDIYE